MQSQQQQAPITTITSTPIPNPIPMRESVSSSHSSTDMTSRKLVEPITPRSIQTESTTNKLLADKEKRRTSLQVILPTNSSIDTGSLNNTPPSPGISVWNEHSPKIESNLADKTNDTSKLNRKESYKAQRKNYRKEKKRVTSELFQNLSDPSVVVLADWLKVRGTLKSWTKLWCILKPGVLLLYKTPKVKSSHWVGTVLLNSCQVIERPSKKDGFCFKLFHLSDQSIWGRGPDKESIGAVVQPLPTSYLIFRAPSQAAGKCWMDALELSLRCSALLVRSISSGVPDMIDTTTTTTHETQWSEADYEKHFNEHDLDIDDNASHVEGNNTVLSAGETESDSEPENAGEIDEFPETPFVPSNEDEFGAAGEQVEELAEEHKSLIWFLVKQVRPGMDLSKVVLPTFILEPRSFLDRLADSYYHVDLLSQAVLQDDPYTRMKQVTKFYLSGFYKKPKGLKKPYNPILGETFRCYWEHDNGSRTYYISEQVSHHPPISAFYVTNRQDGFCISCGILAKSKFYGNSTSAILEGVATMTLLPRGENYTLTIPYAHCKGILMGTLSMELGGKVSIECENTGYKTELEFKLKPFLGGSEYTNLVVGKLKLGKQTLATINGHWDDTIYIKDVRTDEETVLFAATKEIRTRRLKRFTVPIESQLPNESERLWQHVTAAIRRDDQVGATEEKTALEECQRNAAKERKATCTEWIPQLFQQDLVTGQWHYKYADLRPWDIRNDLRQYEANYQVRTKTRHQAPIVRTSSIVSSDPLILKTESRSSLVAARRVLNIQNSPGSSKTNDGIERLSESSHHSLENEGIVPNNKLLEAIDNIKNRLEEQSKQISGLQHSIVKLQTDLKRASKLSLCDLNIISIVVVCASILLNGFMLWIMSKRS